MNANLKYSTYLLRTLAITFLLTVASVAGSQVANAQNKQYQNPLPLRTTNGVTVESCADPSVIQASQPGDMAWYMVCTTDPLHGADRDATGNLISVDHRFSRKQR
jgi:arabinan endo-1,5-alpha-L-arabinosidase